MYNRYLSTQQTDTPPDREPVERPAASATSCDNGATLAVLSQSLSERLRNIHIDGDMLLTLAIVWFLLSDEGEVDTDLLLLIGGMLLLGL